MITVNKTNRPHGLHNKSKFRRVKAEAVQLERTLDRCRNHIKKTSWPQRKAYLEGIKADIQQQLIRIKLWLRTPS